MNLRNLENDIEVKLENNIKGDRNSRKSKLNHHIKLQHYSFDTDLSNIYLISDIGPCFKTKVWDFFLPIYGNYEAFKFIIKNEIVLNNDNTSNDILTFYRKELLKQIKKINSKITMIEFKIQDEDLQKYNLKD